MNRIIEDTDNSKLAGVRCTAFHGTGAAFDGRFPQKWSLGAATESDTTASLGRMIRPAAYPTVRHGAQLTATNSDVSRSAAACSLASPSVNRIRPIWASRMSRRVSNAFMIPLGLWSIPKRCPTS